jgi:hypothetical protein
MVLAASRSPASAIFTGNAFDVLDLSYQHILSTGHNRALLLWILGCILALESPLPAPAIETLFFLEKGEVGMMLRRIHSLLQIPKSPTDVVYVYHKSLSDFLFNASRAGTFHVNVEQCHSDLARRCLHIMRSSRRSVTLAVRAAPRHSCLSSFQHRHNAWRYAVDYWHTHCIRAHLNEELCRDMITCFDTDVAELWHFLVQSVEVDPESSWVHVQSPAREHQENQVLIVVEHFAVIILYINTHAIVVYLQSEYYPNLFHRRCRSK